MRVAPSDEKSGPTSTLWKTREVVTIAISVGRQMHSSADASVGSVTMSTSAKAAMKDGRNMGSAKPRESTALAGDGKTPERWARYRELVKTWNARLNLTGARDDRALADVLFADAAVLADEALMPPGTHFVDIGAGAGAPSIPLLLLRRDLTATLVEPLRKRVAFLRTVIGTLDLVGRCTLLERKLDGPPVEGAPFDLALSRATFAPDEWLERARAVSARAIVMVAAGPLPQGALVERRYTLPHSEAPRALGLYRT